MSKLGSENLRRILKSFGLTEKEMDIYIYIAQHGAQRSGEIAKGIKTHRAEIYRMLKSLQTKSIVQQTLESPTRFTAVPFETVIESFIKTKRQEADSVESTQQDLLEDWKNISKHEAEPPLEKFMVIEGRQKIYSKILKMVNETKNQMSATVIVSALIRADEFGILDAAFRHASEFKVQFRFLTELTEQDLDSIESLLGRIPKTGVSIKGKTPDLCLKLHPQMVIRDDEEALFFVRSQSDLPLSEQDNICLWTNCKSLVLAFLAMFNDSWEQGAEVEEKILEIESGKVRPKTYFINEPEEAYEKYVDTINGAQKEILIITSTRGVIELSERVARLEGWREKGVLVKIMAPITVDNSKQARRLSDFCEVRHVPTHYLGITVVDGCHVFRFENAPLSKERKESGSSFENTFYSSDIDQVRKMKNLLDDLWGNAQALSAVSLESIIPPQPNKMPFQESTVPKAVKKIDSLIVEEENQPKLEEKDILNRIINVQINTEKPSSKIVKQYGSAGQAIIHPSASFGFPDMLIHMLHYEKQSAFGATDVIIVFLWQETPKGSLFVPAAVAYDNPRATRYWKSFAEGHHFSQDIQLLKKNELQIRMHGYSLFCGWTVEIPLLPPPLRLQPGCIVLEGYGNLKTSSFTIEQPSGFKIANEQNGFEAFVTFINKNSKYSGPGTDGFISRDIISTTCNPYQNLEN